MDAAEAHFDRAWKRFEEAEALIPEADRGKPMKPIQVWSASCSACRLAIITNTQWSLATSKDIAE